MNCFISLLHSSVLLFSVSVCCRQVAWDDGPNMRCAIEEPAPNPNPCIMDEVKFSPDNIFVGGGDDFKEFFVFFVLLRGILSTTD